MPTPIRVALPLGIGDCHWSCTKLAALSKLHDGAPIHAYVNESPNHKSVQFLELVPFIAEAVLSKNAPYDIWTELPPNHQHARWSVLDNCRNWHGFDYVVVANGHLERGERLETFLPELDTQFYYGLKLRAADVAAGLQRCPAGSVLLYMSGVGPNKGFHNNSWNHADWAHVIKGLNDAGITPVLIGANTPDDKAYRDHVLRAFRVVLGKKISVLDIVGQTDIPQIMSIIKTASAWVGLNSGLGIMSAAMQTPTIMMWADSRYPISGVPTRNQLHPNMQHSWLPPEPQPHYKTFSYGTKDLTPANVIAEVLRTKR